jgi:hypothetical protein
MSVHQYLAVVLFTSLLFLCQSQDKFNHFKSYKDAIVKPDRYVDVVTSHPIDEYLDPSQKIMHKKRTSAVDHPSDTFDNNWNGFEQKNLSKKKAAVIRAKRESSSSIRKKRDRDPSRRLRGETESAIDNGGSHNQTTHSYVNMNYICIIFYIFAAAIATAVVFYRCMSTAGMKYQRYYALLDRQNVCSRDV